MALEVTTSVSIAYDDQIRSGSLAVDGRQRTVADDTFIDIIQNIGITEEAISLGGLASIGTYCFKNLDPVNFITIRKTTGGDDYAILKPDLNGDGNGGWCAADYAGDDFQAPWAIADTDICRMAVFIIAR